MSEVILPEPFERLGDAQTLIHRKEASDVLGHIRRDHPNEVSIAFRAMIDAGATESEADYLAARALQEKCKALVPQIFSEVDVLLSPGAPGAAPEGLESTGDPVFQRIWTAVGAPCLGFPARWRADGLPLGLQIIALPGTDRQLLSDAATILAHAVLKED